MAEPTVEEKAAKDKADKEKVDKEKAAHGVKVQRWQKQANHFKLIIAEMTTVLNDTTASEEERVEAQQTIDDMNKNLDRILMKHGVSPA